MIIFKGTKTVSGMPFLVFGNDKGSEVEVPVDKRTEQHVLLHLGRLEPPPQPKDVEDEAGSTSA